MAAMCWENVETQLDRLIENMIFSLHAAKERGAPRILSIAHRAAGVVGLGSVRRGNPIAPPAPVGA